MDTTLAGGVTSRGEGVGTACSRLPGAGRPVFSSRAGAGSAGIRSQSKKSRFSSSMNGDGVTASGWRPSPSRRPRPRLPRRPERLDSSGDSPSGSSSWGPGWLGGGESAGPASAAGVTGVGGGMGGELSSGLGPKAPERWDSSCPRSARRLSSRRTSVSRLSSLPVSRRRGSPRRVSSRLAPSRTTSSRRDSSRRLPSRAGSSRRDSSRRASSRVLSSRRVASRRPSERRESSRRVSSRRLSSRRASSRRASSRRGDSSRRGSSRRLGWRPVPGRLDSRGSLPTGLVAGTRPSRGRGSPWRCSGAGRTGRERRDGSACGGWAGGGGSSACRGAKRVVQSRLSRLSG